MGASNHDLSGDAFTHGNIVSKGDKGVWVEPIYPGKHPLNKQVMEVQLVPTTNVVLNFTTRFTGKHGYDAELQVLKLLSHDGFTFEVVTAEQGVNIAELQAAAKVKEAEGQAESIRSIGQAKADAYKAGVDALGEQTYGAIQVSRVPMKGTPTSYL